MEPMHLLNTRYIRGSFRVMSTHETSQPAVGGAGKANIAARFTVLGVHGKLWTVQVQRE